MENCNKFIALYNELDSLLREYYKEDNMSKSAIMKLINDFLHSGNKQYEAYGRKLNMIRIIRNDLVHELDMNSENIIDITNETIDFLDSLVSIIKNPVTALDIATKFENIVYISAANMNVKVIDLIREMRKKGFSQLPILNINKKVIGVFSANVLFDFFKQNNGNIEDIKLSELSEYLPMDRHFSESYLFVDKDINVRDLSSLLYETIEKNEKLAMIFVTESGNSNEELLGIIVTSDFAKAL